MKNESRISNTPSKKLVESFPKEKWSIYAHRVTWIVALFISHELTKLTISNFLPATYESLTSFGGVRVGYQFPLSRKIYLLLQQA